jgi:mannose-6-phosphate isomerase-like protein (cupin superfamily)
MNEQALAKGLREEGFGHTYIWEDGPDTHYPDHVHTEETAHIVLDGEMTLSVGGKTHTYGVGERCDVPAGAVHSALRGPQGCRYLIGER